MYPLQRLSEAWQVLGPLVLEHDLAAGCFCRRRRLARDEVEHLLPVPDVLGVLRLVVPERRRLAPAHGRLPLRREREEGALCLRRARHGLRRHAVAHDKEEAPLPARRAHLGGQRVHGGGVAGGQGREVDERDAGGLGDGGIGAVLGGLHEGLVHGEAAHGDQVAVVCVESVVRLVCVLVVSSSVNTHSGLWVQIWEMH